MGADLYIEPAWRQNYEALLPLFEEKVQARNAAMREVDRMCALWGKTRDDLLAENADPLQETSTYRDDLPEDLQRVTGMVTHTQGEVDEVYDRIWNTETYFRDSYNRSSLLWALKLDWWHFIGGMLDDEGHLPPAKCAELADFVETRELTPPEPDPGETAEEIRAYFVEKRERFVRFLRRGAENPSGIRCSI